MADNEDSGRVVAVSAAGTNARPPKRNVTVTRLMSIAAGVLALLSAGAPPATAASLILNGGFETGTFADWTATPGGISLFGVSGGARSGSYAAFFGGESPGIPNEDAISQGFATSPGQQYVVDFWIREFIAGCPNPNIPSCSPANDFSAYWNGTPILRLIAEDQFDYTEYTFLVLAVGTTSTLSFAAADIPGLYRLDDVSVSAVPEPASLTLLACGIATLIGRRHKLLIRPIRSRRPSAGGARAR